MPLVSVCIICYNHEPYICKAIEGVLFQEGDFDLELIVSNDSSTDRTNEIVTEFINKSSRSKSIKYFNQSKNIGAIPNFIFALQKCTGKYIAICDGDDYWTNPLKLQKQINFMEANVDYSMCFHNVLVKHEGLKGSDYLFCKGVVETTTINDVIMEWYIPTASMLFRNELIQPLPNWFKRTYNGDYALQLILSSKGKIKYFDEIMGVYRKNSAALSGSYSTENNNNHLIQLFTDFNTYSDHRYSKEIKKRINSFKLNNLRIKLKKLIYILIRKKTQ